MNKEALIKRLVDDFIAAFPNASRGEIISLSSRLRGFTVDELELLCTQIVVN